MGSGSSDIAVAGNCIGRVGDCNGIGGDEPTLGDISEIIALLFICDPYPCWETPASWQECDLNQSGGCAATYDDITLGDVSILIDYLFISGPYDPVWNPQGTQLMPCVECSD